MLKAPNFVLNIRRFAKNCRLKLFKQKKRKNLVPKIVPLPKKIPGDAHEPKPCVRPLQVGLNSRQALSRGQYLPGRHLKFCSLMPSPFEVKPSPFCKQKNGCKPSSSWSQSVSDGNKVQKYLPAGQASLRSCLLDLADKCC